MFNNTILSKLEFILASANNDRSHLTKKLITSEEELEKLLTTEYSSAFNLFNEGLKFYRGSQEKDDVFEGESIGRKARDSNNVYTVLLSDFMPSWKNYPPRNKCIIMTDSIKDAKNYSIHAHYIFPHNSASIAICPTADMWDSFGKLSDRFKIDSLRVFNNIIINTISIILYYGSPDYEQTIYNITSEHQEIIIKNIINSFDKNNVEAIRKAFNDCDKIIQSLSTDEMNKLLENEVFYPLTRYIITEMRKKDIVSIINDLLNPKENGFKLVNIDNMTRAHMALRHGSEMWTDSKCLFVRCKEK